MSKQIDYTKRTETAEIDQVAKQGYKCYAVFITTTDIEYEAIYNMFYWKRLYMGDAGFYYYETTVRRDGRELKLVMTRQNYMGMVAAARATTNILWGFVPEYVIMVGVLAGIKTPANNDLALGDVVVADRIWDCSSGKFVSDDQAPIHFDQVGFWPKKNSIKTPKDIIDTVQAAAEDSRVDYPVHIGSIACSVSVVSHETILNKQVISQSENTLGLDMESYGVAFACDVKSRLQPKAIVIKGISDFANQGKSYDFQRYAAQNSAGFAKFLVENYLPMDEQWSR